MRYLREIECKYRAKVIGGLRNYITNLGKDLDRDQDKAGTVGSPFFLPRPSYVGSPPRSRG